MADITMCKGENCTLKHNCYRFKANPSKYRQSYFLDPPFKGNKCKYYWENQDITIISIILAEIKNINYGINTRNKRLINSVQNDRSY